jgi:hypothetical protein
MIDMVPSDPGLVVKLVPLGKPKPANSAAAREPAGAVLSPKIPATDAVISGLEISSVFGKFSGFVGATFEVIVANVGAVPTAALDSVMILAMVEFFCAGVIDLYESVRLTAALAVA